MTIRAQAGRTQLTTTFTYILIIRYTTAELHQNGTLNTKQVQHNLARGRIAVASQCISSFLFTRWQHAICNCVCGLGVWPQISSSGEGQGPPLDVIGPHKCNAKWHQNWSNGL